MLRQIALIGFFLVHASVSWATFDYTDYRQATYGAPNHYCDVTLSIAAPSGSGTLGDPWNLTRCMSQPVAGDVVGILPGVGVDLPAPDGDTVVAFTPANSGTSGSRIVYVTKYAAVALSDVANNANRTELRHAGIQAIGAADNDGTGGATYGVISRNYITFDGFFVDMAHAHADSDTGVIRVQSSTGVTVKNWVVKGAVESIHTNAVIYRGEGSTDTTLSNFKTYDFTNPGGTQDPAFSESYGDYNILIEHFEIDNCGKGIFFKGPSPTAVPYDANTRFNYGTVRYGIVKNGKEGMRFASIDSTQYLDVQYVLLYGNSSNAIVFSSDIPGFRQHVRLDHVTAVGGAAGANQHGVMYVYSDGTTTNGTRTGNANGNTITDSILDAGGTTSAHRNAEIYDANWSEFATNYNYWVRGTNPKWEMGSIYTTIASWRTASGGDAASTYYDNTSVDLFRDRSGSDYRVALGHAALTASSTGGEIGAYAGSEVVGVDTASSNTQVINPGINFRRSELEILQEDFRAFVAEQSRRWAGLCAVVSRTKTTWAAQMRREIPC